MALYGIVLLILVAIGLLQFWLSKKRNGYLGYIIPAINMIFSTIISMLTSTIFSALYVLLLTLSPIIIWVGIYKVSKQRAEKKIQDDINIMKIKDLR